MRLIVDVTDDVVRLTGSGLIQAEQLVKVLRTARNVMITVCPPGMVLIPDRRTGHKRRQWGYTAHIPERRSKLERRQATA